MSLSPCQFNKPQFGNINESTLGWILFQFFFKVVYKRFNMLFLFHINEVNQDHARQISQAYLSGSFPGSFQIYFIKGCFFVPFSLNGFTCVYIYNSQCFCWLNNKCPSTFKPYLF